jgi:hypothetical protein
MRPRMLKILRWLMVMPVMGIVMISAIAHAAIQVPAGYKAEVFASNIGSPVCIKANKMDELFVVESAKDKDRILKITQGGAVSVFAKSGPGLPLDYGPGFPAKIDFDANGNLYTAVVGWYDNPFNPFGDVLDTLYKITPDGTVQKVARQFLSPNIFYDIAGLTFGQDGYLYMGETWTPRDILKVNLTNNTSVKFAEGIQTVDLLFDKQGNLLVVAATSWYLVGNKIWMYTPSGVRSLYSDAFQYPFAITWGPEGYLYVIDYTTKAIYTLDPVTKAVTPFATGFHTPYDIEFDSKGNLYVVENQLGQIIKISKDITTAGTNVRIIDTIPTKDVEFVLSSATKTPYSVTSSVDTTVVEWRYDSINAGNAASISFDLNMYNLKAGENRLVDHKLELLYTDKNGNEIRVELPPIYVAVLNSAFNNAVSTDKIEYQANEDVHINSTITNLSGYARTIDTKIRIEDSQGNLVEEVTNISGLSFIANETKNLGSFIFNTKTNYAGEYKVHLILYENQKQIGEAVANFKILSVVKQADSAISADKMAYSSNEPVMLTSTATSQSPNAILAGLEAIVNVVDPNGISIFTETKTLSDLMPEARIEFKSFSNTQTYPAGLYAASLQVRSNGENLTSASTSFEIISSLEQAKALSGKILANPGAIFEKETTTLAYTIQNTGNKYDLPLIQTEILTVDPDTQLPVRTITGEASLNGREMFSNTILFDSTGLAPKPYLIILRATTAGVTQTLGSAGLIINPIPNNAPIADAGANQSVFAGQPALLDGSQSADPDGDPLSFIWRFISVPANSQTTDASLSNSMTPTPSFVPDADGIYTLNLVVNDGLLDSQTDRVSVFVNPPPKVDIHPETINLKSNGGSKSITGVLISPVLSSFEFFTAEDGVSVTANFTLENRYVDKNGNTVVFTIPAEDYSGDDIVAAADADGDGKIDQYQLTLKFNRDQIIAGFKDTNGNLRITQPTELTSTVIGSSMRVGSDVNTVIAPPGGANGEK